MSINSTAKSKIPQPLLNRGVEEIIIKKDLEKKLLSGKKLRIKHGVDPTSPDLHLGHAVCLQKLKEFQELGHKIIFLIGDFTAKIGDPSGRDTTRPILTDAEIKKNAQTYFKQAGIVLNLAKCEIRYNSEWFEKMNYADALKFIANSTVTQALYREDFQNRLKQSLDISLHEILYPVMQGYDSVELKADLEIGGIDQKLNMLMGRSMQKKYGQKPQDVMIMPLLIGLDGKKKMSKSLGNYIGISEESFSQYSKIMSIPDKLITHYFELAARTAGKELAEIKKEAQNPKKCRDLKASLARDIVALYHGAEDAAFAEEEFNRVFRDRKTPLEIREVKIKNPRCEDLPQLLFDLKLASSKSDARRLITQKAVKIDKAVITDPQADLCFHDEMVVQVGKFKFVKIKL